MTYDVLYGNSSMSLLVTNQDRKHNTFADYL